MRQRHVAHTERGVGAQHSKVAGDHVSAFDAHKRGNLATLVRFADFRSGCGQRDFIRMFAHLFAHSVNLVERMLDRFRPGNLAGDPNRKENRAEPAFLHARNVDAAARAPLPEIEIAVQKPLRCVVMGVHNNRRKVQLACPRRAIVRPRLRGHERTARDTQSGRGNKDVPKHFTSLISPKLRLRLQFTAHTFHLLHDAQRVPTQNLANVVLGIALA